jgi:hypothetical protein
MFDRPTRAVLFGRLDHVPKAARKDISDLSKVVTLSDGRGIMPVPISDNGFSHIKVPGMLMRILVNVSFQSIT